MSRFHFFTTPEDRYRAFVRRIFARKRPRSVAKMPTMVVIGRVDDKAIEASLFLLNKHKRHSLAMNCGIPRSVAFRIEVEERTGMRFPHWERRELGPLQATRDFSWDCDDDSHRWGSR